MYSVNGVPLDNPLYGWVLRSISSPLSNYSADLTDLRVPYRIGPVELPSSMNAPTATLVVQTPRKHRARLFTLMRQKGARLSRTADPTREVRLQWMNLGNEVFGQSEEFSEHAFQFKLNDVFWRDTNPITSAPIPLTTGIQTVRVLHGLSAPVSDAMIRVKGTTGLKVLDPESGTFFTYPAGIAASYLRFEAEHGRAFVTATDTWTGGDPVKVGNGPGAPLILSDVYGADISAVLTVYTTARVAATLEVRARRAHAF